MKRTKLFTFAALLIAAFFIVGIQSCQLKTKPLEKEDLNGFWVLKSMNGQDVKTLFEGALPTLEFDFAEGNLHGTGGCNRYNGGFKFSNNVLTAPNLASTMMLCTEKNKEDTFLQELAKPSILSIEGNILTFTEEGQSATLVFERGEEPAKEDLSDQLTGNWTLKKIGAKDVSEVFKGTDAKIPTLTFNFEDFKINGTSGCNNYMTSFTLDKDNNSLTVLPIASTRMACPNMEGEALYLSHLTEGGNVNLPDASTLQLQKNGITVLEYTK